jgi:alkylation response protein AidB-like acyl-CoA dehydrogenase
VKLIPLWIVDYSAETSDPVLRDAFTRVFVEATILGLLGERVLAAAAEGEEPGAAQSVIKLAWSQVIQGLGEAHFDLLGADGLIAPPSSDGVSSVSLRTRSSTIAAGTTKILRDVLAERVLGLPRR